MSTVSAPGEGAPSRRSRPSRTRRRAVALGLLLGAAAVFVAVALLVPAWWATVPVFALLGVVSGRRHYWLAGTLGILLGALFWIGELEMLPSAPVSRLTHALAGAEGLSPTVMWLIGPILFGIVTALAAWTVAGGLRLVRKVDA